MEDQQSTTPDNNNQEENKPAEAPVSPDTPQSTPAERQDGQYVDVSFVTGAYKKVADEVQKVVVGHDEILQMMLTGLFTGGHILLEGVPGIAKTLTAKLLAECFHMDFKRIQFTPDLMPSDLTGTNVFNAKTTEFEFKKGPLFANVVLIDEINRAPAKTQAALFEVMEEKQISNEGITHKMIPPFFVIATQNPIEQEGTYRLPEAQLDRFLFKLKLYHPNLEEEKNILKRFQNDFDFEKTQAINAVLKPNDIDKCTAIIEKVHVKESLIDYIAAIVYETRENPDLILGASPRASLAILKTAKALAAVRGKDFVTPDEIQTVAYHVLNHRIMLTPDKEMEGKEPEDVIEEILQKIEVPR